MSVAVVSGSAGLIGSEASSYFGELGYEIVGIDNDMRQEFFGPEASTGWNNQRLQRELGARYTHHDVDVRSAADIDGIFRRYGRDIELVIHTAAQPSHDWAARAPHVDFGVNANGTLNMLEATRKHASSAAFIFTSTNKVYGDTPNRLPLIELASRWEIDPSHTYANGIREDMPIDQTLHSVFGASKLAADIMVQEFGRYFEMPTACFRGGCLTGPNHAGTKLHGFLAYLMRCAATDHPYAIYGYKGKQVRDNIHAADLIRAFHEFAKAPRRAEVYNIGGGRLSNCSLMEAIEICERITGRPMTWEYVEQNRRGDHVWWVSDNGKFAAHYPGWHQQHDAEGILIEIYEKNAERWRAAITGVGADPTAQPV